MLENSVWNLILILNNDRTMQILRITSLLEQLRLLDLLVGIGHPLTVFGEM